MTQTTVVAEPPDPHGTQIVGLGPVEIADLILATAAQRTTTGVLLAPRGRFHVLHLEEGPHRIPLGWLESRVADAVVARLSIVAGIDVGASSGLGRLRAAFESLGSSDPRPASELLIAVRRNRYGLLAETRRIAGWSDEASTPIFDPTQLRRCGAYRIIEQIGDGGMGIVYRAEHEVLEKPVALKILKPAFAHNPALIEQLLVEGRAACLARHPGIVDVTDFGRSADGQAFLVMELLDAPTLAELLESGPLPWGRAIGIARQIAEALAAAAEQGVVHRDLKPTNVFVGADDRTKIGDFGIARIFSMPDAVGRQSRRGWVGTPRYMSPEQAAGAEIDGRSDLYSLGCVLFEMLTGAPPFVGQSHAETVEAHACDPIPAVRTPEGLVPPMLERLIQCSLAKRPEDRYRDAAEMSRDLVRAELYAKSDDWRRWLP